MNVNFDILADYKLFDKLPDLFKKLEPKDKYVFFYFVDEEAGKLIIYDAHIQEEDLNVSIYRELLMAVKQYKNNAIRVGYFEKWLLDTRDGLFYQFLRTYNDVALVDDFMRWAKKEDELIDINITCEADNNISTASDFQRVIGYFCPDRTQTIMLVYNFVNDVFQKKVSKSVWSMVDKVVNLVKYDGGVLPERNGLMRFIVIGVNAQLNDSQKDKLAEANKLLRSGARIEQIYLKTGWGFGIDGKFRTNISDKESALDFGLMRDIGGGTMLYLPDGYRDGGKIAITLSILQNPDNIFSGSYSGRLPEVLKHPTLYKYYPKLKLMPLVYRFGGNNNRGVFYFSPSGFIVIDGNETSGDSLSILLHETQHSIQNIEGFATGGNDKFAAFVAAVGSESVRTIFASINRVNTFFKTNLLTNDKRVEIIQISPILQPLMNTMAAYEKNLHNVVFNIVLRLKGRDRDTTKMKDFLVAQMGDIFYELFENIRTGDEQADKIRKILRDKGLRDEVIEAVLFSAYENLYGESESRSVQSSRFLASEFRNYFYLSGWEHNVSKNMTIIDGVEKILDTSKIHGAIESKEGKYVFHFLASQSCVPFIHELGHIVYDEMVGQYGEVIKQAFEKANTIADNEDEYFVSRFLGWIESVLDIPQLSKDFNSDYSIGFDETLNECFEAYFQYDSEPTKRLKFLQSILAA